MSFEEEFDSIMRQKAGEADFPFDEKNWDKARMMLDAERKKVGMTFMMKASLFTVLFLGLATATWFIVDGSKATAPQLADATSTEQTATSALVNSAPASKAETSVSENVNAAPVSTSKETNSPVAVIEKENPALSTSSTSKKRSTAAVTTLKSESAQATTEKKVALVAKRVSPIAAVVQPNNGNTTSKTALPAPIQNDADKMAANTGDKNDQRVNTNNSSASVPASSKEDKQEVLPFEVSATTTAFEDQLLVEPIALYIPESPATVQPDIYLGQINTLNYFDDDYYTPEKYKTHYLNVEAGAAYLYGWAVKNTRDGQGLNWFGGLNYGFYISKKADISIGVQGYNIANINKSFFDNSRTTFGFSSVTTRTTITTNSLYYLAFPVKFTWAVSSQNSFGLGCNFGLLMDSRNTMETTSTTDIKTEKNTVNTKGFYEGMNPTNVMMSAFYRTKFGDRLFLNGEITYSPFNIYKYSESKVNTANTVGIRVSLQFNLFDK